MKRSPKATLSLEKAEDLTPLEYRADFEFRLNYVADELKTIKLVQKLAQAALDAKKSNWLILQRKMLEIFLYQQFACKFTGS